MYTLYRHRHLPYEVSRPTNETIYIKATQQRFFNSVSRYYNSVLTFSLLFQVQAIYQKCNRKATCNCGVAVKSGDFVFFADRCRRKSAECNSRHRTGCGDLLETYTYEWDNIPAGTRIFRNDGGRTFDVRNKITSHQMPTVIVTKWTG